MTKKSDAGRTILEILEVWFAAPSHSNFGCRIQKAQWKELRSCPSWFCPKQHQSTAYRIQASLKKNFQKKSEEITNFPTLEPLGCWKSPFSGVLAKPRLHPHL